MRICFALPGLHRVNRGAETAFESVASELADIAGCEVTLFGSGAANGRRPYRYEQIDCRSRDKFTRWPAVPGLRSECAWEDLSFARRLLTRYNPADFDVTVTCSYPWSNWLLRLRRSKGRCPRHVYVTQNGDWPCFRSSSEFRFFGCDALICTNPDYFERQKAKWRSFLIPNGVDPALFSPGAGDRGSFALPRDRPVVLMVSALIPSKRVIDGIKAAALLPDSYLVVAGDGPLRGDVIAAGQQLLPGRFKQLSLPRERMPDLYRCADVFLHMSLDEPSANAYIEALSTGLPIVTHDRAVTRWTLRNHAILVDSEDVSAVAGGLNSAQHVDRPAVIRAQREMVESRFSWRIIAREYLAVFHSLCSDTLGESAGDEHRRIERKRNSAVATQHDVVNGK